MIKKLLQHIGPGPLVAAAFIGPGTVTVCSIAGVSFGYNLLWAMLISIIATLVLQEMAARIGVVTQKGISEILRQELKHPVVKALLLLLVISAIAIGNAAYEAGNISGGVLGLSLLLGDPYVDIFGLKINYLSILIGGIAFLLLAIGNYKIIERSLIGLVVIMSITFIATAFLTQPSFSAILNGLIIPKFPEQSIGIIIGLIGTTVVPYNLFLHAALVKEKWPDKQGLYYAKRDTIVAIILGGLVSLSIIITAAATNIKEINTVTDLGVGLEPLLGAGAQYFLAIGLFAAGITSAITAPLAAAYVVKGCLGWTSGLKDRKFKGVWMFILLIGIICSSFGIKSIEIIQFAQITNGILLPIIAGILLWLMNKKELLGKYVNSTLQNVMGVLIVLFMLYLSLVKFGF